MSTALTPLLEEPALLPVAHLLWVLFSFSLPDLVILLKNWSLCLFVLKNNNEILSNGRVVLILAFALHSNPTQNGRFMILGQEHSLDHGALTGLQLVKSDCKNEPPSLKTLNSKILVCSLLLFDSEASGANSPSGRHYLAVARSCLLFSLFFILLSLASQLGTTPTPAKLSTDVVFLLRKAHPFSGAKFN